MQLSEAGPTGETGGDSDGDGIPFIPEQAEKLPPVLANQAVYDFLNATYDPAFANQVSLTNSPNPFTNETVITFNLTERTNVNLSLFNINGTKIRTITDSEFNKGINKISLINVDNIPTGIYFIKLKTNKGNAIHKLIIE